MREFVERENGRIVEEIYVPMLPASEQLRRIAEDIRRKKPDAVFSTVVGRGAQDFYRIYREVGIDPAEIPIASLTMGETEIRAIGPELNGVVSRVSPDVTIEQRTGQSYYTIRVSMPPQEIARLGDVKLIPGMPVEAFVQTGDRTMMSYLIKPLSDQLMRTFRER